MNQVARDLVAAFKASEKPEMVAALIVEDGFDAFAIRVLAAWMSFDHSWKAPQRPCPDNGRATPKAWAWLVSGMALDYVAIADAADLSSAIAQRKLALLLRNRLIYPDGTISKAAGGALQAAVFDRVKQPKKQEEKKPAAKSSGPN